MPRTIMPKTALSNSCKAGPTCRTGRMAAVAMMVALAVASVSTMAAEAQLPPPTGEPTGTYGSNSVGQIIFFAVVAVMATTVAVLYLRHRRRQP
jgi:H+/Cl- antiporter ClcA